jgi:predicted adenylyl cyclase CyaB
MPKNVEIKARLASPEQARKTALRLSGNDPEVIDQHDVFFASSQGRLKLRMFPDGTGEFIEYHRADTADAKTSSYRLVKTSEAQALREILKNMGASVTGEVRKRRLLYLVGQTRVHIDRVEGLGNFLELEVVLRDGQPEADGSAIADRLMKAFSIDRDQLVAGAYVDLIGTNTKSLEGQT